MTTDEVLKLVESRALEIVLSGDGKLALRGDMKAATGSLMRVLKLPVHRDEILDELNAFLNDRPRLDQRTVKALRARNDQRPQVLQYSNCCL